MLTKAFLEDFAIAEVCGLDAIRGTFRLAFDDHRHDPTGLACLCRAVHDKLWEHYGLGEFETARAYEEMYFECQHCVTCR